MNNRNTEREKEKNQKQFDYNKDTEEETNILWHQKKYTFSLMCYKPWLPNLWVETRNRVMGVCLMITRLLQQSVRSAEWDLVSELEALKTIGCQ